MGDRYNWKAIEYDYKSGLLTLVQIREKHDIDPGYLTREAKKRGWKREKTNKSKKLKLIEGAFISEAAKQKHDEIKRKMGDALTELDDIALIPLCNQYARMLELELLVMKEGVTVLSQKGVPYNNPNYNALLSTVKTISALSKELGLTVSSRKRAGITPNTSKNNDIFDIGNVALNSEDIKI